MTKVKEATISKGSGNVFADIGLPDADDLLRKAELVRLIVVTMNRLKLSQTAAARRANMKQPDLSKLLNGRTDGISYGRLIQILAMLGNDVNVTVRPASDTSRPGCVRVLEVV
jgi:predicted XRE-type DNA-binding protein